MALTTLDMTCLQLGFSVLTVVHLLMVPVLFGIQAKNGECKPLGVCENCVPSGSVSHKLYIHVGT